MKYTEPDYEQEDSFRQSLDYEKLLNLQISRISSFRSNMEYRKYFNSVDTFIMMMPEGLRSKAWEYKHKNNIVGRENKEGVAMYDDLYQYCNTILEESNLIFRTKYIKTYK